MSIGFFFGSQRLPLMLRLSLFSSGSASGTGSPLACASCSCLIRAAASSRTFCSPASMPGMPLAGVSAMFCFASAKPASAASRRFSTSATVVAPRDIAAVALAVHVDRVGSIWKLSWAKKNAAMQEEEQPHRGDVAHLAAGEVYSVLRKPGLANSGGMVRRMRVSTLNTLSSRSPNRLPSGHQPLHRLPAGVAVVAESSAAPQLRQAACGVAFAADSAFAAAWASVVVVFIGIAPWPLRWQPARIPRQLARLPIFRMTSTPPRRFADEVRHSARLAAPLAAGHLSHGPGRFRRHRGRRSPWHHHAGGGGGRHRAVLAADDAADGHADGLCRRRCRNSTARAARPDRPRCGGSRCGWRSGWGALLFALITVLPWMLAPMGIAPDIIPGATDFPYAIRWGIPRSPVPVHALPQRWPALVAADDADRLRRPAVALLAPAGYVVTNGLFGPAGDGRGRPRLGVCGDVLERSCWRSRCTCGWRRASPTCACTRSGNGRSGRRSRGLLGRGLPIGVTITMEGSLFIVTTLLIGRLGDVSVAAHQVAINVATLCFMIPFGWPRRPRCAWTMRWDGDRDGIRRAYFAGLALVLGTQALSALVMLFGNHAIVAMYTGDAGGRRAGGLVVAAMPRCSSSRTACRCCSQAPCAAQRHPGADAAGGAGLLGHRHAGRRRAGAGAGLGGRGMWLGLTAGLSVAAFLLCRRFLRSNPQRPHRAGGTGRSRAIGHRDRCRMSFSRRIDSMSSIRNTGFPEHAMNQPRSLAPSPVFRRPVGRGQFQPSAGVQPAVPAGGVRAAGGDVRRRQAGAAGGRFDPDPSRGAGWSAVQLRSVSRAFAPRDQQRGLPRDPPARRAARAGCGGTDKRIDRVVLHLDELQPSGFASARRRRVAIAKVRPPASRWSPMARISARASTCSRRRRTKVYLDPMSQGGVMLEGLAGYRQYFRQGLQDKLGVDMHLFRSASTSRRPSRTSSTRLRRNRGSRSVLDERRVAAHARRHRQARGLQPAALAANIDAMADRSPAPRATLRRWRCSRSWWMA